MAAFLGALFFALTIVGGTLWLASHLLQKKIGDPGLAYEMERRPLRPAKPLSSAWFFRYMGL